MGDVAGGLQFTYVSLDDYRIVLSQLNGHGERTSKNRGNVPYSVFMDTPLSRVGITERDAAEKGLPYRVLKMPAAAVPKAQVLRKTDGMLKAVVNTETGRILGVSLLCVESYEMINTVKLAMDMDAPYTVLRDQIFTHPTMMLSRYLWDISCRSAISFSGMYSPLWCSARSTKTRSAYLPLVEIIISGASRTKLFLYYTAWSYTMATKRWVKRSHTARRLASVRCGIF